MYLISYNIYANNCGKATGASPFLNNRYLLSKSKKKRFFDQKILTIVNMVKKLFISLEKILDLLVVVI